MLIMDYLIELINKDIHAFRLLVLTTDTSTDIKNLILKISMDYIVKFFQIDAGKTEKFEEITDQFFHKLTKIIPNLFFDSNFIKDYFYEYHTSIFNLKHLLANQIFTEITKEVKINVNKVNFDFLPRFSTFIVDESKLESKNIISYFIGLCKSSITGYNSLMEAIINRKICELIQNFKEKAESSKIETIRKLDEYFSIFIDNLNICVPRLYTSKIENGTSIENDVWTFIEIKDFIEETMELSQILGLKDESFITKISLKESNRFFLVIFENLAIYEVIEPFPDQNTVIASGSVPESLILFQNTLKKCLNCKIVDNKLIIISEIKVYTERILEITSACFIKIHHHFFYLNIDGIIGQASLYQGRPVNMELIEKNIYSSISVDTSGKTISLASDNHLQIFNHKLELVHHQNNPPSFSFTSGNCISLVNFGTNGEFVISKILMVEKGYEAPSYFNFLRQGAFGIRSEFKKFRSKSLK